MSTERPRTRHGARGVQHVEEDGIGADRWGTDGAQDGVSEKEWPIFIGQVDVGVCVWQCVVFRLTLICLRTHSSSLYRSIGMYRDDPCYAKDDPEIPASNPPGPTSKTRQLQEVEE